MKITPYSTNKINRHLLTACLLQFPPSYLWLYFLRLLVFHHESHFAYHHMVLFCDALIHYYLSIAHFFQIPPSAHYITMNHQFPFFLLSYWALFFGSIKWSYRSSTCVCVCVHTHVEPLFQTQNRHFHNP